MFIHFTIILASIMVTSCLISMMVIFISGIEPGIVGLLNMQLLTSLLAVPICIAYAAMLMRRFGIIECWRKVWDVLPGWLVFAFVSINSLVLSGAVSLMFAESIGFVTVESGQHIPLVCALANSVVVCLLHAWRQLTADTSD